MRSRLLAACAVALFACTGTAAAQTPFAVDTSCFAPAGDPAPGSPEWTQRDLHNQYCSTLRNRDQLASPAYGFGNLSQGGSLWLEQMIDQFSDPTNPRGGFTTLIPGSRAADAFRTIKRWTGAGRGRVAPVRFPSENGSTLRGYVFAPPASVERPAGGFPGVVITDGSVQGYQELYFWAAQDLAENGYVVMTYDVQGQGTSDLYGDDCPGECTGVPYQQDYNFFQGARDSLDYFLSGGNPYGDLLDEDRVGIAGHSLGASAVSTVGQCDERVKTIVAWDNLRAIDECDVRVPALAITNDYGFFPTPTNEAPNPHAKDAGYQQIVKAGLDSQIVTIRNGTHLAYTYVPLVLPSNEIGERMASYYTLAWLDYQLKGDRTALQRLTATRFDDSVDRSSIGAGVYDPTKADPTDPYAGNQPYLIEGIPVKDAVSFSYLSSYSLEGVSCADMRAGCAKARAKLKRKRARRRR